MAAGDLSKQVSDIGGDDEIGRLARAVGAMIVELRRLAEALNESVAETGSMTARDHRELGGDGSVGRAKSRTRRRISVSSRP